MMRLYSALLGLTGSMEIVFLGTSSATPTRRRNVSALGLRFDESSQWWLFDCGEGTQHRLLRSSLSLAKLEKVFITHLHGDHIFGLPGLLSSRSLAGSKDPIQLYGPPSLEGFLRGIEESTPTHFAFETRTEGLTSGTVLDFPLYTVRAMEVIHTKPTFGFVIDEKPRPGRFRVLQAVALGIPPGPIYGRLKQGERVTLDDGRVIDGSALIEEPQAGRRVVIIGDSCDSSSLIPFAMGAHAVVHEATFLGSAHEEQAKNYRHSTALDAGRFAEAVGARTLIMNHFSPRYESPGGEGISALIDEAKREFKGEVIAAFDGLEFQVARDRVSSDSVSSDSVSQDNVSQDNTAKGSGLGSGEKE